MRAWRAWGLACAGLLVVLAAVLPVWGGRSGLLWGREALVWGRDRLRHPLRQVAPLRGAALVFGPFTAAPPTIWADQPAQAARLSVLDHALRTAHPVAGTIPSGGCGPMITSTLLLLPRHGPEISVMRVWRCTPTPGQPEGGHPSRDVVQVTVGDHDMGQLRAPGLVSAFSARWPAPPAPLTVAPARCAAPCRLTVRGAADLATRTPLYVTGAGSTVRLAEVSVRGGRFTWQGHLPRTMAAGRVVLWDRTPGATATVTVLPSGDTAQRTLAGVGTVAGTSETPLIFPPPAPVAAPPDSGLTAADAACQGGPPCGTAGASAWSVAGAARAWAGGTRAAPGTLFATRDGGSRWRLVHSFGASIVAVAWTGAEDAWAAVGAGGDPCPAVVAPPPSGYRPTFPATCLAQTTDGGRTWTLSAGAPPDPRWVDAGADGAAVVVTGTGGIYRTAGPGTSWTPWAVTPAGTATVAFGTPAFGAAVAATPSGRWSLYITQDGGRTWNAESLTALTGTPDVQEPAISVTADHTIWLATRACAPEGTCTGMVLVSADRGHTWRRIDVGGAVGGAPPQPQGFRLAGVSARAAWLIVPDRLPYHTTDGGRSWALQA